MSVGVPPTRLGVAVAALALALGGAACDLKPADIVEPSSVGVVATAEADGDLLILSMTNGSEVTLELNRDTPVIGGAPTAGDLFFVVEDSANGLHYATFSNSQSSAACPFVVQMGGAWEEPSAIVFERNAFRFPKADEFVRPPWQHSDFYSRNGFCLDREGRVLGVSDYLDNP